MGGRCIQLTATLLSMLASVSLGLGVANVIAVYFFVYSVSGSSCPPSLSNTANCPYRTIITLAFIGSGIWGSLVVFAIGILAIKSVSKQFQYRSSFQTATFITAIVIVPAMIVLNAVNAALVTNENSPSQVFNATALSSNLPSAQVLFALPICVSGVGALEFVLMAGLIVYTCMCVKQKPDLPKEPAASLKPAEHAPATTPAVQPPAPAPAMEPGPGFYAGPGLAYSPYGQMAFRRTSPYGSGLDYGGMDPTSLYRPALRVPYNAPAAAAGYRYPVSRPIPLSYIPPSGY